MINFSTVDKTNLLIGSHSTQILNCCNVIIITVTYVVELSNYA